MKYIIGFAIVLFFIGCSTTREFPDDRYQPVYEPVYQPYGYVDPYYNPAYDYSYRDRVIYENAYRNRQRAYRYENRQPEYRYEQQQPRYRVIEPRVQERQAVQPRVVQPRDIVYPDGTIKKADGTFIHPGQKDRN